MNEWRKGKIVDSAISWNEREPNVSERANWRIAMITIYWHELTAACKRFKAPVGSYTVAVEYSTNFNDVRSLRWIQ